jgi:hypothetical protein
MAGLREPPYRAAVAAQDEASRAQFFSSRPASRGFFFACLADDLVSEIAGT